MIKNILKGAVVGIANIIPGVSGGTMMVSMGLYDKLIHCITHLFKEFKESLKFLFPILVGAAIALVASAFGLEYLFENFPIPTNLLFIGLIVGGLPAIGKKVKGNKIQIGHVLAFLAFFLLVVGLAVIGETEGNAADMTFHFVNVLKLFGVGIIASATMVVPGVSGSMILLILGYYNSILSAITDFITAVFALDWTGIWTGVGILLPFGVGMVFGIFAIAKIIEIIFDKFPMYAYWAIIGLIVASPIAIVLMNLSAFAAGNLWLYLIGAVCLVAGGFAAMKLGE